MRVFVLSFVLFSFILPTSCASVVIVVLDGFGALYLSPNTPHTLDGTELPTVDVPEWMKGMQNCTVLIRVPETSTSLAILFTGCRMATPEMLSYENATIFDILRNHGYHVYGIMEQGDNQYMLSEFDGAISFRGNPEKMNLVFIGEAKKWESVGGEYEGWSIREATQLVKMLPEPFVLVLEVASIDIAGHGGGVDTYLQEIEQTLNQLEVLVDACREEGIMVVITADHGMAFRTEDGKGGHASVPYRFTDEVRIAPLYIGGVELMACPSSIHEEEVLPLILTLLDIDERPKYVQQKQNVWQSKKLGLVILFLINLCVYIILKRR